MTREEAQAYLDGKPSQEGSSKPQLAKSKNEPLKQIWNPEFEAALINEGCLIAFADGACRCG